MYRLRENWSQVFASCTVVLIHCPFCPALVRGSFTA